MTYVQPVLSLLLVSLFSAALVWKSRFGRTLVCIAGALLFLWGWPPLSCLFSATLERRYPIRPLPQGDAQAIVVLGGGLHVHDRGEPQDVPNFDSYARCSHAAWLYRNWKAVPILASGGITVQAGKSAITAQVMRRVLLEQGVPPSMVWTEEQSQSTYENALYSTAMLRARGIQHIALVTEAYHMWRSEGCFRRLGLQVTPAPVLFQSIRLDLRLPNLFPSVGAMQINENTLHEWVGVGWYKLRGRI